MERVRERERGRERHSNTQLTGAFLQILVSQTPFSDWYFLCMKSRSSM
jgi:hypothetical protein